MAGQIAVRQIAGTQFRWCAVGGYGGGAGFRRGRLKANVPAMEQQPADLLSTLDDAELAASAGREG